MKHHLKKLRHSRLCYAITLVGLLLVGILHTSLRGGETSSTGIDDLLKGSWMEVELSPYTELARSILTSDSLLHEGQSTDVYEGRQVYVAAARLPWVRHICEIGFNGGASASLWLLANPNADVTMFDDWKHPYADAAERFLRDPDTAKRFRLQRPDERLEIIKGFSNVSLRRYAVQHTHNKCDLMVIDGGHSYREALSDITNMMSLANPDHHLLIVDDSNCDAFYCVDEAVAEHQRRGTLHTLGAIAEQMMPMGKRFQRGLTLHQYRGVVSSPLDSKEYRNFLHGRWSTLKTHREEGALKAIYPSSFLWKHASVIQLVRSLPLLPGVNHACVATQDPAAVFLWASLTRVRKVTWITSHPEDVALAMAKKQGLPSLRTIIAGEPIRVSLRKLATAKPAAGCNVATIHGITAVDEIIEVIDAFRHVMALGRHNAFLLIDETNCASSSCVDAAVEEHERRRTATAILRVSSVFDASVGAFLGGATVLTMDRTSLF